MITTDRSTCQSHSGLVQASLSLLGPAMSDNPSSPAPAATEPPEQPPTTPQVSLTFLLVSTRRRTMSYEPDTTIGRVKELLWNTWPSGLHSAAISMSY